MKPEFLIQPDTLAVHVVKVLDHALNSPFEVVIDMSWSCITADIRRRAFAHLDLLHKIFSKKYGWGDAMWAAAPLLVVWAGHCVMDASERVSA